MQLNTIECLALQDVFVRGRSAYIYNKDFDYIFTELQVIELNVVNYI